MNPKQRAVLIIGIILLFVIELFPPYLYEDSQTSRQYSAGYHFILSSEPNLKSEDEMIKMFSITSNERSTHFAVQRDLGRRYGQWLALLFLTIGLLVFLMESKSYVKVFIGGFIISIGIAFLLLVFYESWFIHI
jgi:hypothetical protein